MVPAFSFCCFIGEKWRSGRIFPRPPGIITWGSWRSGCGRYPPRGLLRLTGNVLQGDASGSDTRLSPGSTWAKMQASVHFAEHLGKV